MSETVPPNLPPKWKRICIHIVDLVGSFIPPIDAVRKSWIWITSEIKEGAADMIKGWHLFLFIGAIIGCVCFYAGCEVEKFYARPIDNPLEKGTHNLIKSSDTKTADLDEHDERLSQMAYDDGQAAHSSLVSHDWENFVKHAEESYVLNFQLSTRNPKNWIFAAKSAGALVDSYSHFEKKENDIKLAQDAIVAINRISLNLISSTNSPEIKPAVELFNKLAKSHPDTYYAITNVEKTTISGQGAPSDTTAKQWFIKILNVETRLRSPNPLANPPAGSPRSIDTPKFRFVAEVNGAKFAFPVQDIWADTDALSGETWPIDASAKTWTINFSGWIMRSNNPAMIYKMGSENPPDIFDISQFPMTEEADHEISVQDVANMVRGMTTTAIIHFTITNR
jgi:hypothetical protein